MADLPAPESLSNAPAAPPLQESSPEQFRRSLRALTSAGPRKFRSGVLLPLDEYLAKAGRNGPIVHACFARFRNDRTGEVYASYETVIELAEDNFGARLTRSQVDRALRLAHAVGLVRDVGHEFVGDHYKQRRVRQIFGQVIEERGRWFMVVPAAVAAKLRARRGRGRPPGSGTRARPVRDGNSDASEWPTRTRSAGPEAEIPTHRSISSSPPLPPDPGGSFSSRKNHDLRSVSFSEEVEPNAAQRSTATTHPPERAWPEKQDDAAWLRRESGATSIGSTPSKTDGDDWLGSTLEMALERLTISLPAGWHPAPGLDGVPDRPSRSIFYEMGPHGYPERTRQEVTIPRARAFTTVQLRDKDSVLNRMRNAYAGATRRRWLPRWTGRQRRAALELARQLANIGAAPETWLLWRSGSWREINGDRSALPLNAALSVKLFEDERRIAIFQGEESSYVTSIARPAKRTGAEQELWRRWERMMAVLEFRAGDVSRPAPTRQEIDSVVERSFPGDLWHRLVDRARREIDEEQRRIDKLAEEGRWLWS